MPTTVRLTDEQERAIAAVLEGVRRRKPVQTIGGYAGTGKTTLIRSLARELRTFAVCAFTGKAAAVLRRKGVDAGTIHSLIYEFAEDEWSGEVSFRRRRNLPCSGVIVDEASMVGRDIFADLLRFGLPLIFVGDHGQLEPVGDDARLMLDPEHRLETIHRNAGEISRFAEWLRMGRDALRFPTEEAGQVEFIDPGEIEERGLWESADQIICAYNRTRVQVNALVRGRLGRTDGPVAGGERVICLRNDRERGLYNGMQGTVLDSRKVGVRHLMGFESYGSRHHAVPYDPETFGAERPATSLGSYGAGAAIPFDHAYCITCHKAQGDEFGSVLVIEQKCSAWDHARWTYTAASRARQKIYWVRGY